MELFDESDDYLKVHVLTWNVGGNLPAGRDIEALFLPQESLLLPDLYNDTDMIVIGLQEAYPQVGDAVAASLPLVNRDPLVDAFSELLARNGFARVASVRLLGIVTMVFVKRPLLCYVREVQTSTMKTGLSGLWGNKGASSIRFFLGDVSVCFTNCHLVPHVGNNERRVQELHDIILYQVFNSSNLPVMTILDHDIAILFGDLNFRLEGKRFEEVVRSLSENGTEPLQKLDQLRIEQIKGHEARSYLQYFMEMQLDFAPSYKYEPGSDVYHDGGKGQAPAWCDRILWAIHERCLPKVTDKVPRSIIRPMYYGIHMQPRISDHKAISAGIKLMADLNALSPQVIFRLSEWVCSSHGKIEVDIAAGTNVSVWDWIGLFPANFSSCEKDYVFWVYTPATRGVSNKMCYYCRELTPDQVPAVPGTYLLLYKSSYYKCILGMSPMFRISATD